MTFARMRCAAADDRVHAGARIRDAYGGTDATLGLAFTRTGVLYPFFAADARLARRGADRLGHELNVLFGSLQKITAQQLGLNPMLITTANSTGGVMGKMIDAQSIVVATAATNQPGRKGRSCGSCSGTASRSP